MASRLTFSHLLYFVCLLALVADAYDYNVNDSMYFLRHRKSTDVLCTLFQLVIGSLNTSRSTGRLQFCDQTGSIDCVVGAWPSTANESSATSHYCGSSDCAVSVGQRGGCPFIQTSLLGGVFRVDRFQLVVETFRLPNGQITAMCPYIQFSATDLLQLCGQPQPNSSALVLNQLSDSENVRKRPKIAHNGSIPRTQPIDCHNDSCEDMFASFVDSPVSRASEMTAMDTVDHCRCSISQLFVFDRCENILLRSRHIEQLSLQFTATGYFVGPPKPSSCRQFNLSFFSSSTVSVKKK